ncbi:MAG: DNA polymerase III subunit gamma/tau [Lachnospiraceae bacterium]|nr:DNA polymerase III subunit gamma/tau [Lachnospiraceae bacterium]
MSYTALYRKFRPDTFSEVKGQDHVVRTLQNQMRSGRIGHAYLFCGTRGTGKTSVAKIMAKAVNCENPQDGEPCGTCKSCRAVASGSSLNVIEIDAASNNGVDNIRQIREEVAYSPAEGKYKVYIIDEVHMLSQGAFNALLKTLEEPPSYVIFILATTEAHKVPVTIVSRCQRYDFHRISQQEIAERLTELLAREGVEADEKAIRCIARKADGGMRDALSLADQCISFYLGEPLTYEKVLDVLGTIDTEEESRLLAEILRGDVTAVFAHLEEMIYRGRDLSQLIADFTWYLRNVLLVKASDHAEDLLDVSEENMEIVLRDAASISEDTLIRYIRVLGDLSNQLRFATGKRVVAEVGLLRLCRPQMQTDRLSLAERLDRLEEKLSSGAFVPAAQGRPADAADGGTQLISERQEESSSAGRKHYDIPAPDDLKLIRSQWKGIVSAIDNPRLMQVLLTADLMFSPEEGNDQLIIVFRDFLGETYTKNPGPVTGLLEELIEQKTGKHIRLRMIVSSEKEQQKNTLVAVSVEEAAREHIHMPLEIEDDDN